MTVLVVDGANVVGSRPNGWWRDRAGAAVRLRDALVPVALSGIEGYAGPLDVILVVEGAARGITGIPDVRVVTSPGSGDDTIVQVVRDATGPVVVVTSDRELRTRVVEAGATVVGPRSLPY